MSGVDVFRSETQKSASRNKAEKMLGKMKVAMVMAIVVTLLWMIGSKLEKISMLKLLSDALLLIVVIMPFAIVTYLGAWNYMVQLVTLPFRKMGVGIISIVVWLVYATILLPMFMFFPILPVFYFRYLANITMECTADAVS